MPATDREARFRREAPAAHTLGNEWRVDVDGRAWPVRSAPRIAIKQRSQVSTFDHAESGEVRQLILDVCGLPGLIDSELADTDQVTGSEASGA